MSRRSSTRLVIGLLIFAIVVIVVRYFAGSLMSALRSMHGGGH